MHKRVVVAVSTVLFTLLAVVVVIVTDLHDRGYPEQLRAKSSASLDFASSDLSDEAAFQQMGELSDRLSLRLVRVAPDLSGDQSGQVYVALGERQPLPDKIRRFGDEPDGEIRGRTALANSYASGQYLVTGETTRLGEFQAWLKEHQVGSEWSDDNLSATLMLVVRQSSFAITLVSATALMVSLVLYWLSVKANGRALRVLAGVSAWRIQYEDLVGFLAAMSVAAVTCDLVAVAYVGVAHGLAFLPYYALTLLTFNAIVVFTTMLCAVAMSVASWPSTELLAAREPAVKSLRKTSIVLKAVTFALVLTAVAPALGAYADARKTAAQQAQWKSLADQVAITFPAALGESGFEQVTRNFGGLVSDAEVRGSVALSYTWTRDFLGGVDLGPYDHLALVSQGWLDLMLTEDEGGSGRGQVKPELVPLPLHQVPEGARQHLGPNLELWSRSRLNADEVLRSFSYYRSSGSTTVPVSLGGNGDLAFPENALIIVAPNLHGTFNDDFLASVASTNNLVFAGLGSTQALIARHELQNKVNVKYVAEEGVLRAQITAYLAWLQGIALVALIVALVVSALVGAFITAVLKARRDFPLLLAGKRWSEILGDRVAGEWGAGLGLAVLVVLVRGPEGGFLVAGAAVAALLVSPLAHLLAARWAFTRVTLRKL